MKEQFRVIYKPFMQYIQFKDCINIFGFKIPVWRYLPDHFVAGVFKRKHCPIYLPFSTSHCYLCFCTKSKAMEWHKKFVDSGKTIEQHLAELKDKKTRLHSTIRL